LFVEVWLVGTEEVASGPLVVSVEGAVVVPPISGLPVEEVASGALVESLGIGLPLLGAPPGIEALVSVLGAGVLEVVSVGAVAGAIEVFVSAGALAAGGELGVAGAVVSLSLLLLQPTRASGTPRRTSARRECFCKKCFIRNN
jgi:hypothetical protein